MDYEKLSLIIPKVPEAWNQDEVLEWLQFAGLKQFIPNFKEAQIDGSIILLLEERDLEQDLNIQSNIVKKKLLNWIKNGLKEYTQYLLNKENLNVPNYQQHYYLKDQKMEQEFHSDQSQMIFQVFNPFRTQFALASEQIFHDNLTLQNQDNTQMAIEEPIQQKLQKIQQQQINNSNFQQKQSEQIKNQDCEIELIITPTETSSTFYCIKQQGGKIGRHSSNQMIIMEESVSRYHAELMFQNIDQKKQFFIKDIGSTTGTFIKIIDKLQLQKDMIIEMGSFQYIVEKIQNNQENGLEINLYCIEGPNQGQLIQFVLNENNQKYSVGRKITNDLSYPDDHHMSSNHAKFYLLGNNVMIEDLYSTNGTWLRLSKEGLQSEKFPLYDQDIFKVGATSNFKVNYKYLDGQIPQQIENRTECVICCDNDRDVLYMPCRHNSCCYKCSKGLTKCPICKVEIQELIKIYRA